MTIREPFLRCTLHPAIVVVLISPFLFAQTQPIGNPPNKAEKASDTPASLTLKANTRLVMADVLATDGKGIPITDLKIEDFVILEDSKEQKVRTMTFHEPSAEPKSVSAKLPANVVTNKPSYQGTNAPNVILIDALNTNTLNQTLVRKKILEFLGKMPADQPIAVYMLGNKLRMLKDFTTDPANLQAAMKEMSVESNALNSELVELGEELFPGYFDLLAFKTDMKVAYTTQSLRALARRLSGLPGRKNLIWISGGFPLIIDADSGVPLSATRNYSLEVAKTVNAFLDAQVAIYPINAGGLSVGGLSEANSNGKDQLGRSNPIAPGNVLTLQDVEKTRAPAQQMMNDIANRTGGKAFHNQNDLDAAIASSIADGSTYYLLGYYPEDRNWNGQFRKIQIKLNRPGAKLRFRPGYYALDPDTNLKIDPKQRGAEFVRALNADRPISTALKFEAALTPPSPATSNKLGIKYTVDGRAVTFDADKDGVSHVEVQCAVRVYSDEGKFVKADVDTMSASVKPEAVEGLRQRGFPCEQGIELAKGNYWLRLGVRDTRSGLIGTANARIAIP